MRPVCIAGPRVATEDNLGFLPLIGAGVGLLQQAYEKKRERDRAKAAAAKDKALKQKEKQKAGAAAPAPAAGGLSPLTIALIVGAGALLLLPMILRKR